MLSNDAPLVPELAGLDAASGMELLMDVPVRISVQLGHAQLAVRDVLALQAGSCIELNRLANEPLEVLVNDRLIARGEMLMVDNHLTVRITELVTSAQAK